MRALQAFSPDDISTVITELLAWFQVLRACAAVLAVEALGLGLLSFARRPKGVLRVGALLALAAAIATGVLARDIWVTYWDLLPDRPRMSLAVRDWYLQTINQTIPFYETAGRIAVVVTSILLVAGLLLIVKAIQSGTFSPRRRADPAEATSFHLPPSVTSVLDSRWVVQYSYRARSEVQRFLLVGPE